MGVLCGFVLAASVRSQSVVRGTVIVTARCCATASSGVHVRSHDPQVFLWLSEQNNLEIRRQWAVAKVVSAIGLEKKHF